MAFWQSFWPFIDDYHMLNCDQKSNTILRRTKLVEDCLLFYVQSKPEGELA
jgi:hypothetical protein